MESQVCFIGLVPSPKENQISSSLCMYVLPQKLPMHVLTYILIYMYSLQKWKNIHILLYLAIFTYSMNHSISANTNLFCSFYLITPKLSYCPLNGCFTINWFILLLMSIDYLPSAFLTLSVRKILNKNVIVASD